MCVNFCVCTLWVQNFTASLYQNTSLKGKHEQCITLLKSVVLNNLPNTDPLTIFPHGVVTPTIKFFSFLQHNYNFATVMDRNINSFRNRDCDPQVENCWVKCLAVHLQFSVNGEQTSHSESVKSAVQGLQLLFQSIFWVEEAGVLPSLCGSLHLLIQVSTMRTTKTIYLFFCYFPTHFSKHMSSTQPMMFWH